MRRWAHRSLHVLASAPVLAFVAATPALPVHAQETAPTPYVVAVDAGHGGTADNDHPEVGFDSGAVGVGGLLEKDLTLDIARRLRDLLEQDFVTVAMTRDSDRYVSIEDRSRIAQQAGASLFVSVHLNSWTDASVGGSLVLYPGAASSALAATMSEALRQRLGPLGVESKGTELRDNWWIHTGMPAVTVEAAYVTNVQEASLLSTAAFRQSVAQAIRAGLETYDPTIGSRRAQIAAWVAAHPSVQLNRGGGWGPRAPSGGLGTRLRLVVAAVGALLLTAGLALRAVVADPGGWGLRRLPRPSLGRLRIPVPRSSRRRRQRLRQREAGRQPVIRPHSVYDELWF